MVTPVGGCSGCVVKEFKEILVWTIVISVIVLCVCYSPPAMIKARHTLELYN